MAAALAAAGAVAAAPAAAAAPPPALSGTTAAGVPFVLHGRSLRIVVPKSTRRGSRIEVRCGRLTTAELVSPGLGFRDTSIAEGSRVFGKRRTMMLRLNRDVSGIAEWCEFETEPSGRRGAAVLHPRLAPRPSPLFAGPGVREAVHRGGARFLLDGSTLTLRTARPLPGDVVLFLACYGPGEPALGARSIAIGDGRRAVTVDLGRDVEAAARSCFAESSDEGDLFLAGFAS